MNDGGSAGREQKCTLYEGINESVSSLVPVSAKRILDIGCGTGALGEHLRTVRERYVAGVTYSRQEAEIASERLSKVVCADLNSFDLCPLGTFDCIILSHILEHLYSPASLLDRLRCVLEPEAIIIVALPNVVWWKQRLQFLLGHWRYEDWGILDRTHFRFFDQRSSAKLLEDSGYEILLQQPEGPFPVSAPVRSLLGRWSKRLDHWVVPHLPGLLAMQFVYVARLKAPKTI